MSIKPIQNVLTKTTVYLAPNCQYFFGYDPDMFPGIVFWETATKWESKKCVCLYLSKQSCKVPEGKHTDLFYVSIAHIFSIVFSPIMMTDSFWNILILFPTPFCKQRQTWEKWLAWNNTADGHCTWSNIKQLWEFHRRLTWIMM